MTQTRLGRVGDIFTTVLADKYLDSLQFESRNHLKTLRIVLAAWAGLAIRLISRPEKLPYTGQKILLLGNGPSVLENLSKVRAEDYDLVAAVNALSTTDLFRELKPRAYFLQDSYWFDDTPEMQNKRDLTGQSLQKADWTINIYFPRKFRDSAFVSNLRKNPNINLRPLGQYDFSRLDFGIQNPEMLRHLPGSLLRIVFWLWSKRLANVPATGIVSNALFELIRSGAETVHLAGVDMTMGRDLSVNSDSTVTFSPTHFYRSTQDVLKLTKQNSMSSNYLSISQKFLTFDLLAKWANHKNCEVMVLGSTSLLDSFPRLVQ